MAAVGTDLSDIDLMDPDAFVRMDHHDWFTRLRAEDPVHWYDDGDGRGLLEPHEVRRRRDGQPRLRALLVADRRHAGVLAAPGGRDGRRHRRSRGVRGPRRDHARHGSAEAHALPPARQQGLHAAHDRPARAVPAHTARTLIVDNVIEHGQVRLRHRPRVRAPAAGDRRDHGRPAGGPHAAVRVVEQHDRRRRPRVPERRTTRQRDRSSSTRTPTTSPRQREPTRATTSSPSCSTPRSTATSSPSSSSTCSCCCSRSRATRPRATRPRTACTRCMHEPRAVRGADATTPTVASTPRSRRSCAGRRRCCTSAAPPPPTPRSAARRSRKATRS